GSRAIITWASRISRALPSARSRRRSRSAATSSSARSTRTRSTAGSPVSRASGSSRTGTPMWATGPIAMPGLTPRPTSWAPTGSALLGVEVGGHHVGDRGDGRLGLLPLGGEHDGVAVLGPEGEERQDAPGVDGVAAVLGDLDRHRLRGGRLRDQGGGAGVKPDLGAHHDGAACADGGFGHGAHGSTTTLIASPDLTASIASPT